MHHGTFAIDSDRALKEKIGAEQSRAPESRIGLESSGCVTGRDPVTLSFAKKLETRKHNHLSDDQVQ
jgi:hypothetical protein